MERTTYLVLELQKALEESRQAQDLMKIVEIDEQLKQQEQFEKKDTSKSPDPPPSITTSAKKMNFAMKVEIYYWFKIL